VRAVGFEFTRSKPTRYAAVAIAALMSAPAGAATLSTMNGS
jgi:hypothetical protein